jgi:hypothetical protein
MLPGVRMLPEDLAVMAVAVAERYEQGWTIRELAAETGRSTCWIHGLIHSVGPKRRTWQRRAKQAGRVRVYLTGAEQAKAVKKIGERYAAGETLRELADATGFAYSTVQRYVRLSGVPMRTGWETRRLTTTARHPGRPHRRS